MIARILRPFALAALLAAPALAQTGDISWSVRPADRAGTVQFDLRYDEPRSRSHMSNTVPLATLSGLTATQLASSEGVPVRFRLARDAGTLDCEGLARRQRGQGECRFAPNPTYTAALERRGVERPSTLQQFQMALHDVDLALVDELARQGYKRDGVNDLIAARIHGVGVPWLRELNAGGYRAGSINRLVEMRIHGVSPSYIRELASISPPYRNLTPSQLVEMKIHNVEVGVVRELAALGLRNVPAKQLVELAIHGVSPAYIRGMREAGYQNLTPRQLVDLKIHGVTPETALRMNAALRTN